MTLREFFNQNNLQLPYKIIKELNFKEKEILADSGISFLDFIPQCIGYWTEDESYIYHRPVIRWVLALNKKQRLIDLFTEPDTLSITIKHRKTFYELYFQNSEDIDKFIKLICINKIDGSEYMRKYHNIPIGGYKYDENNPIKSGQIWVPKKSTNLDRPIIKIDNVENNQINATLIYSDNSTAKLHANLIQFQNTDLNNKKYKLLTIC